MGQKVRILMILALFISGFFSSWGQTKIAGWTMDKREGGYVYTRPDLKGIEVHTQRFYEPNADPSALFQKNIEAVSKRYNCTDLKLIPSELKKRGEKKWNYLAKSSGKTLPTCFLIGGSYEENSIITAMAMITSSYDTTLMDDRVSKSITEMLNALLTDEFIKVYSRKSGKSVTEKGANYYSKSIPQSNNPAGILEYSNAGLFGGYSRYMLLFKDGTSSLCSDWDPGFYSNNSSHLKNYDRGYCTSGHWRFKNGKEGGEIEIRQYPNWIPAKNYLKDLTLLPKNYRAFKDGEMIDLSLVSNSNIASKIKSGNLDASSLKKWEAVFTKDGRFFIGHLEASSIPLPKKKPSNYTNPASGRYYFNGHTVTLILDTGYRKGHIVRGFSGWVAETEKRSKTILINNQKFNVSKVNSAQSNYKTKKTSYIPKPNAGKVYSYVLGANKANLFSTPVVVRKGDTIKTTATGFVKLGAFAGGSDPDGLPNGMYKNFNRVNGANHGALLCRIGEDKRDWVAIGKDSKWLAYKSGTIYFCINDKEFLNNSGQYNVSIEVIKGAL